MSGLARAGAALPRRALMVLLALLLDIGLTAATPAPTASVLPVPGATLARSPAAVRIHLPGAAPADSSLSVLDSNGTEEATAPLSIAGDGLSRPLPDLPAGLYTVEWRAGAAGGSSTFTVWKGGPLPPGALRAADGGPTPLPTGWGGGLWIALALVEGMAAVGAAAFTGRRTSRGIARRAALIMAVAAVCGALAHTRAVLGANPSGLGGGVLEAAVLVRGVGRDGLVAALLALLALPVSGAAPGAACALIAGALGLELRAVPAVAAAGPLTWLLAWLALGGAALYAGAWPHALRSQGEPAPLLRLLGLVMAIPAGGGLLASWRPLLGLAGPVAAVAAAAALVLGRPGQRGRAAVVAAIGCGLLAAAVTAPALDRASVRAGRAAVARAASADTGWSVPTASGEPTSVALAVRPLQVGANVLRVHDPTAQGAQLPMVLTLATNPAVARTVRLQRIASGTYALDTDALSLPGVWQAEVGGASFAVDVGRRPVPAACPLGFAGLTAGLVRFGEPVHALAVDPGDGDIALAATASGVYRTADGGLQWQSVGGPPGVRSLAVGLHGQWLAGTALGLWSSSNGGATWSRESGVRGPVTAIAAPLYPLGSPIWIDAGGTIEQSVLVQTPLGFVSGWGAVGQAASGITALLALPTSTDTLRPPLLAAGNGLSWSADGGRQWSAAGGGPPAATVLAADAAALWAGTAGGLWTAATPAGQWHQVHLGVSGAVTGVAASGPGGKEVTVAVAGHGILHSSDAGAHWTPAGCTQAHVVAMAGTFSRGVPLLPDGPLAYVADSAGDLLILSPPPATGTSSAAGPAAAPAVSAQPSAG